MAAAVPGEAHASSGTRGKQRSNRARLYSCTRTEETTLSNPNEDWPGERGHVKRSSTWVVPGVPTGRYEHQVGTGTGRERDGSSGSKSR